MQPASLVAPWEARLTLAWRAPLFFFFFGFPSVCIAWNGERGGAPVVPQDVTCAPTWGSIPGRRFWMRKN